MKPLQTFEEFINESIEESTIPDRFKTSEEEHKFLVSNKPKNTFRQLV